MAPVVAVADLFMGLMLSAPGGLSLRTAWVTPATLLLTCLYAPIAALLALLLVLRGGWLWIVCALLVALTGLGSSAVSRRRPLAAPSRVAPLRTRQQPAARRPPYSPAGRNSCCSPQGVPTDDT
jgi:hypothetical protein